KLNCLEREKREVTFSTRTPASPLQCLYKDRGARKANVLPSLKFLSLPNSSATAPGLVLVTHSQSLRLPLTTSHYRVSGPWDHRRGVVRTEDPGVQFLRVSSKRLWRAQ
ncbi:mCG1027320, partial [Mus musculus]